MFSVFKKQPADAAKIWERIKLWLQKNAPHMLENLNIGAADEEISNCEATLQTTLPDEFKAFLKIHNGQLPHTEGLIDTEELLSIERILNEWKVWKDLLENGDFNGIESEPDTGVKNNWWNIKWIPLTYDGSGNHYCLDLDPAPGGTHGQIIRMWHDGAERTLHAKSFIEWIGQYVQDLEKGQYVYSEDWGGITNREDA